MLKISLLDYELWNPCKEKIYYSNDLSDMNITARLLVNRYSADLHKFFIKRSGESVTLETDKEIRIKYTFKKLKYEVYFPINASYEKLLNTIRANSNIMLTSTAKNLLDDLKILLDYEWNVNFYHPAGKFTKKDRGMYINCILMFFNVYKCSEFSAEQMIHLHEIFLLKKLTRIYLLKLFTGYRENQGR